MKGTIAICGLGQIGGSLAASLKARDPGWTIRAADRRRGGIVHATERNLVDEVLSSAREAARNADVVVLAAPVRGIKTLLEELGPHLEPGQVVTDVGSTKTTVVAAARAALPEGVAFVGGHPIAGTERSGIEAAQAGLFQGRPCVLTPVADTSAEAVERVATLWRSVGAEVVFLEPEDHDRVFAHASHLPHAVAYSVVKVVEGALSPRELSLAGRSLKDLTRVAQSPSALWRDVCLENREALLAALDGLLGRLGELRSAVDEGDPLALDELLESARRGRAAWTR